MGLLPGPTPFWGSPIQGEALSQPGPERASPAHAMSAWLVAWLQAVPQGVITLDSAQARYGLSDLLPHRIHMTVPRTTSRRRPEPQLHTKRLAQDDVTHYEGLPITTVLRTLVDVTAAGLAGEQVRQANQEALRRGLVARESFSAAYCLSWGADQTTCRRGTTRGDTEITYDSQTRSPPGYLGSRQVLRTAAAPPCARLIHRSTAAHSSAWIEYRIVED
jgi:hypothetical protein